MRKERTRNLVLVALFAILTAIGAYIRIPIPHVPITFQLFFCSFAGILLGPRLGMLSQALYVAMGLAGIPVFTGGGGLGYVFHPTFGYLIGFILCAGVTGAIAQRLRTLSFIKIFMAVYAGVMAVYLCGVPWLYFSYNFYLDNPKTVFWAVFYGFAMTIGADTLRSLLVSVTAVKLIPVLKNAGLLPWLTNMTPKEKLRCETTE